MIAGLTDFVTRVLEFLYAFLSQYFLWTSGVVFLADQILSRNFWPKESLNWLHKHWPEENRHRFFRVLAIVGIAIAAFFAFDQVNEKLKTQIAQLKEHKTSAIENRASVTVKMSRVGWLHEVLERYNVARYPLAYKLDNGK